MIYINADELFIVKYIEYEGDTGCCDMLVEANDMTSAVLMVVEKIKPYAVIGCQELVFSNGFTLHNSTDKLELLQGVMLAE